LHVVAFFTVLFHTSSTMKNFPRLIISLIACELVGVLSTPFTIASIPAWYAYLNKPSFSPPNWVFAPAWITLYFLMGVSFYLIWNIGWEKKKVRTAGHYFYAQLLCNFLWSLLFFGLRSPILGLVDIILLWLCIFFTMIRFRSLSKIAFYLLIPYLLWVSFAALLNVSIVVLN
jgi:translocator protein